MQWNGNAALLHSVLDKLAKALQLVGSVFRNFRAAAIGRRIKNIVQARENVFVNFHLSIGFLDFYCKIKGLTAAFERLVRLFLEVNKIIFPDNGIEVLVGRLEGVLGATFTKVNFAY